MTYVQKCMKPVVNLAFSETVSFEIQRMSSETYLIWQSRSLLSDSGTKGKKWSKERLLWTTVAQHAVEELELNKLVQWEQKYRILIIEVLLYFRQIKLNTTDRKLKVWKNKVQLHVEWRKPVL